MDYSRRNFIKNSALASAGSFLVPSFLSQLKAGDLSVSHKNLIIIQLSGGNDGLNTVVPYQNDIYYRERSSIALNANELLKLDDSIALNKSLKEIADLYNDAALTIINGVGYPNPNRSHFRSMDIWQSASDSNEHINSGWIGRYLDAECKGSFNAIEADDTLSLAMKGKSLKGLAVKDVNRLVKSTRSPKVKALIKNSNVENANLSYMYKTLIETEQSASYLSEKLGRNLSYAGSSPQNEFERKLNLIADLINSGVETQIYYAELGGFDTHVRQKPQHNRLLDTYSSSISSLVSKLKRGNNWNNTLILTFSEFGRRVKQNGAAGTDHGTANNIFLMSGALKNPGVFNNLPDLRNLDQGDLRYTIDFREIYASILEKWLDSDSSMILGRQFKTHALV